VIGNNNGICLCVAFAMFFYTAKLATAAAHISRQKISGINTNPYTEPSFIPFPFGVSLPSLVRCIIKIIIMQKQLRIITNRRLSVCPFSRSNFQVPPIPHIAFSRHLRRLSVHFRPLPGVYVYRLSSGWFIWCYPSGRRQLSALPF
jgi:hypothetical protein